MKKYGPYLLPRKLDKPVPAGTHLQHLRKLGMLSMRKLNTKMTVPYHGDALPKNFDWRDVEGRRYVPEPFDQGGCGSCYACAVTYMFMSNVMVTSNLTSPIGKTKRLSI